MKTGKEPDNLKPDLNLADLPQEILLKIFQYLPQFDLIRTVSVLSKYFNELSKDRNLSISLQITIGKNSGLPQNAIINESRVQQIKAITFTWLQQDLYSWQQRLAFACSIGLTSGYLTRAIPNATEIKKLTVQVQGWDDPVLVNTIYRMVDERSGRGIVQDLTGIGSYKSLQHLDVYLSGVKIEVLEEVLSLPRLQLLRIRLAPSITTTQFIDLASNVKLSHLREFCITFDHVDDRCVTSIMTMCPNLVTLAIDSCDEMSRHECSVTPEGVKSLFQRCDAFQRLTVFEDPRRWREEWTLSYKWQNMKEDDSVQNLDVSYARFPTVMEVKLRIVFQRKKRHIFWGST